MYPMRLNGYTLRFSAFIKMSTPTVKLTTMQIGRMTEKKS